MEFFDSCRGPIWVIHVVRKVQEGKLVREVPPLLVKLVTFFSGLTMGEFLVHLCRKFDVNTLSDIFSIIY